MSSPTDDVVLRITFSGGSGGDLFKDILTTRAKAEHLREKIFGEHQSGTASFAVDDVLSCFGLLGRTIEDAQTAEILLQSEVETLYNPTSL